MKENTLSTFKNGSVVVLLAVFFVWIGGMLSEQFRISRPEVDTSRETKKDVEVVINNENNVEEERSLGHIDAAFENPFVAVAEKLKPSVVNITVVKTFNHPGNMGGLEEFFGIPVVPREYETVTGGSGVILNRKGYVVTNNHVIENASEIVVTLYDGSERKARLLGRDPETDIALLNIDKVDKDLVASLGNSDKLKIGEWAIAMGNPLGLDWTLTVGVISAIGRSDLLLDGTAPVFQDFIQTDASINHGNSGGPLSNIYGEVIGINTATNTSAQGIGFAIPINMVKSVVDDLAEKGHVKRGYLGLIPSPLDKLKKEALGLDEKDTGVFIESVADGTPADRNGLKASDVILELNGDKILNVSDFRMKIASKEPGERIRLKIFRKKKARTVKVTLADRAEFIATADPAPEKEEDHWLGLKVGAVNRERIEQYQLEVDQGVFVLDVKTNSPAEGKLQPGDVIVKVGKRRIDTTRDWQRTMREFENKDKALLVKYYRGGRGSSRFVALKR